MGAELILDIYGPSRILTWADYHRASGSEPERRAGRN